MGMLQLQKMGLHGSQLPETCKQVDDTIERGSLPHSGNVEIILVEFD